jgi:23S rRNA (guanosine2251-2'-O)-methyltransferase
MGLEKTIFGRKPVSEAFRAGAAIEKLFLARGSENPADLLDLARHASVPVQRVPPVKLNQLAGQGQRHQGVVAIISEFRYADLDHILLANDSKGLRLLVLDRIQDPHNLGAIARSAEAAGFAALIISRSDSARINDTVVKTSAGAVMHLPIVRSYDLSATLAQLNANAIRTIATGTDHPMTCWEADFTPPFALLIGNEAEGIRHDLRPHCQTQVSIPMYGKIASLNASVSAAILMFASRRNS